MVHMMYIPILLLMSTFRTDRAETFNSVVVNEIDHVVQAGMTCHNNPGLAVAVVKDGQVLLSKGYGVTDLDSQQPVTTDTQFQIASLTKAFTAALLATVLDEEPGTLSTNVRKVDGLPSDFAFNNSLRTIYATLEDLLAHRTGIPRNNYIRLATDHNRQNLPPYVFSYKVARQKGMRLGEWGRLGRLKYLPNAGGFRDSFYYSDLMYALAAYVTQLLGNKPWEDLMREKVLTPLGMSRTTFISDVDFSRSDVATAYVLEHGHLEKASIDFISYAADYRTDPRFPRRLAATPMGLAGDLATTKWRLEHKTGLTYEGRWVKGPPTINKDFAFLANGQEVYGVEALEFEDVLKSPSSTARPRVDQGLIG
nr:hypothetical protein BaRGS_029052 [Batillaria attramentaria]